MNKDILHDRYEFTDDNTAVIEISLETVNDLFNSFDKKTSFYKRELDQDFEDYLIASIKELDGYKYIIKLNFEKDFQKANEDSIKKAIKNHFRFLYWREKKKITKEIYKIISLTLLGIAFMAFYYEQSETTKELSLTTYSKIVIEGINIAGWVAFWEAFSALIFNFTPIYKTRNIFKNISVSNIQLSKTE